MTSPQPSPRRVRVDLGSRSYDILIGSGLLANAGGLLSAFASRPRVFIVTDETVAALHLETLKAGVSPAGLEPFVHIVAPGEASKSLASLDVLLDWLIAAGAGRDDILIALGGGVVGDLTGLAAALMKRGMKFVQAP
ncbi:MAG: iron-containing alcohol dehydrogenase, partial [Pseudomonadota bacterium]